MGDKKGSTSNSGRIRKNSGALGLRSLLLLLHTLSLEETAHSAEMLCIPILQKFATPCPMQMCTEKAVMCVCISICVNCERGRERKKKKMHVSVCVGELEKRKRKERVKSKWKEMGCGERRGKERGEKRKEKMFRKIRFSVLRGSLSVQCVAHTFPVFSAGMVIIHCISFYCKCDFPGDLNAW